MSSSRVDEVVIAQAVVAALGLSTSGGISSWIAVMDPIPNGLGLGLLWIISDTVLTAESATQALAITREEPYFSFEKTVLLNIIHIIGVQRTNASNRPKWAWFSAIH